MFREMDKAGMRADLQQFPVLQQLFVVNGHGMLKIVEGGIDSLLPVEQCLLLRCYLFQFF